MKIFYVEGNENQREATKIVLTNHDHIFYCYLPGEAISQQQGISGYFRFQDPEDLVKKINLDHPHVVLLDRETFPESGNSFQTYLKMVQSKYQGLIFVTTTLPKSFQKELIPGCFRPDDGRTRLFEKPLILEDLVADLEKFKR